MKAATAEGGSKVAIKGTSKGSTNKQSKAASAPEGTKAFSRGTGNKESKAASATGGKKEGRTAKTRKAAHHHRMRATGVSPGNVELPQLDGVSGG